MGKDKNEERKFEKRLKSRGTTSGSADWKNCNPELLVDTIATIALHGGALRFGYTRDGGAYAIGVYGDGSPYTVYVKPGEVIDDYLVDLRDGFASLPVTSGNSG